MAVNGKKRKKNGHTKQNGHSDWAPRTYAGSGIIAYSMRRAPLRRRFQIEYTLARRGRNACGT